MEPDKNIWPLIVAAAIAEGAKPAAIKKWRRRGVPHKWRVPIVKKTGGAVTHDDFARLAIGDRAKAFRSAAE
jgi:hypothetical protein